MEGEVSPVVSMVSGRPHGRGFPWSEHGVWRYAGIVGALQVCCGRRPCRANNYTESGINDLKIPINYHCR